MEKLTYSPPESQQILLSIEATCCIVGSGTERLMESEYIYDTDDFIY